MLIFFLRTVCDVTDCGIWGSVSGVTAVGDERKRGGGRQRNAGSPGSGLFRYIESCKYYSGLLVFYVQYLMSTWIGVFWFHSLLPQACSASHTHTLSQRGPNAWDHIHSSFILNWGCCFSYRLLNCQIGFWTVRLFRSLHWSAGSKVDLISSPEVLLSSDCSLKGNFTEYCDILKFNFSLKLSG